MTAFAQLLLFLSSYAPLFAVFALLDTFGKGWPSIVCVVAAVLGGLIPFVVLPLVKRRVFPLPLHVATSQIRDGDAIAYIATYLVPFAAIAATSTREKLALGLFFAMIAAIYVRSELFYINPLLALRGYRLFQVVTPKGTSAVLITRRRFLASESDLSARRLGSYVYWEA
jgi:hypothetical protein